MALLAGIDPTAGQAPKQARVPDEQVWVGWSAAAAAKNESELEGLDFEVPAGSNVSWALTLNNVGATSIWNVTLVLVRTEGVGYYEFGETYAGDPPSRDHAFWKEVPPGWSKLVTFTLTISDASPHPFAMDFLVLHERDGVEAVSSTHVRGSVTAKGGTGPPGPVGDDAVGLPLWVAAAGGLLAAAARALPRRRS